MLGVTLEIIALIPFKRYPHSVYETLYKIVYAVLYDVKPRTRLARFDWVR